MHPLAHSGRGRVNAPAPVLAFGVLYCHVAVILYCCQYLFYLSLLPPLCLNLTCSPFEFASVHFNDRRARGELRGAGVQGLRPDDHILRDLA